MAVNEPGRRQIHITTLMVPVTYEAVLSLVPGFHTRPPTLPEPHDPAFPIPAPPEGGYDFILHVGVAGRGPLRMEKLGHKLGYGMKDAQGKLAPIVELTASGGTAEITEAERIERERLPVASVDVSGDGGDQPVRGFGKGYEIFDEEIYTDIDVERLVAVMKESGYQIYTSMDAGHYLCDFIYYCSLAESRRTSCRQDKHEKGRGSQVLFLHCPPVHQPLSTQEVTEALKSIIVWVARGA
ncbi:hypothetical protein JAAARDRAFT_69654 [Jaapia argillacea MUCL 33604]|uniref:Peptidase C15, pyroglutamyl peptidase I-like protein n=1 Tax=Jaapia argillacea MUCL 33604 TaxID=933084 RepID=A0A067Q4L6_9AGAM|nr:hypothetical protein JAAARDRAFT_69654 [Jaapia argillacea MUCL 33604]